MASMANSLSPAVGSEPAPRMRRQPAAPRFADAFTTPLRIAPVPITPTKPLTPSHLKGLLCTDVMERATELVRPVVQTLKRPAADLALQTLAFWSWLSVAHADEDWQSLDEVGIGRLYMRFHAIRQRESDTAKASCRERTEALREQVERGWVHPSGLRMLQLWRSHYERLGIRDPGLLCRSTLSVSSAALLAALSERQILLDTRALGGPCYLDLTQHGLPLRMLIDLDGQTNYLLGTLRQLVEPRDEEETIALLCDAELSHDYHALTLCLRQLGKTAFFLTTNRVPLPETGTSSARHGGWEQYTVDRIVDRVGPDQCEQSLKLGLRMYLIAGLGPGGDACFDFDLLRRCVSRARRILDKAPRTSGQGGLEQLRRLVARHGYVDPYRVTCMLLASKTFEEMVPWIAQIFL